MKKKSRVRCEGKSREQRKHRNYKLKCGIDQPPYHQEGLSRLSSYTPNSTKPWQLFALYLAERETQKWAFYAFMRMVRRDRHTRRIISFIVDADTEVLFVTVWFARLVDEVEAKRIGVRLLRRLMAGVVHGWVRIVERHKDGRLHLHFLVKLAPELAGRVGIKAVRVELRRKAGSDGIRRCYVHPAKVAEALGRYLVKTYGQPGRVGGRVITYSRRAA